MKRDEGVASPKPSPPTGPFSVRNKSPSPTTRRAVVNGLLSGILAVMVFAAPAAWSADPAGGITGLSLAPHAFPRGKTMFVELPAEMTGIRTENRYADPKMRNELYQEFETSSIGTGVAIGDYDGDGRPDIFVVSKTESCRLFRNLGNWKFEDVTDKAGVGDKGADALIWKQGATFVDVNNDGLLDIYVCRYNAPNLLYINQGDGTFKEMAHAYGLDVNDSSVMASFCDYDRDGWLDVYIATNILNITTHPNGQRGYLFHNNRDGTFTNVTDRAGIRSESQSHSATWWDYDNDGWPDLYVANDYGAPDKLYHNNRDGTFTDTLDRVLPHTSFSSMGSDLGDVNNDGLIDFLSADMATTNHEWDHHMMADARGRSQEPPDNSPEAPKYHRSALLLNTGTGHCLEAAFLAGIAATDWTWSPRFEDLDNDGRLDFFVTNGFPRDPSVDVVSRMQAAETPVERIRIMYASPPQAEVHLAYRNLGDLQFEDVSAAWGLNKKGVSFGAAFGDLAGDGNLDIVYSNYHGGVTVLRNDNDTGHRVIIDLRGTVSNRFGVGATVRIESALGVQVRQLVLARGYMSSSEPMVHFGLGADTSIRRLVVTWPSGHVQTFENLAVDRRFTITEPSGPAPALATKPTPAPAGQFAEMGQATGLGLRSRDDLVDEVAVQRLLPVRLNRRGPGLAVGDIEGNGRDAVVVGGTTLDPLRVLVESAPGKFSTAATPAIAPDTAVDDGPTLLFDADGDGRRRSAGHQSRHRAAGRFAGIPAAALAERRPGRLPAGAGRMIAATPRERRARSPPPTSNAAAGSVYSSAGGFEPGRIRNRPEAPCSPTGEALFRCVIRLLAPGLREVGMVTSALWSDVDGDGWPDLLVTHDWGNVKYFHNIRERASRIGPGRQVSPPLARAGGIRSPRPTSTATAGRITSWATSDSTPNTAPTPSIPRSFSPAISRATVRRSSLKATMRATGSTPGARCGTSAP